MSSPSGSNVSYAPDRPARFKDSCDSCAQAKVKCSRDRPSCQRCVRSGVVCHYSLARRGKAASAAMVSRHANATKSPAPRTPRHSVSSLSEVLSSHAADPTSIDEEFALSANFMSREANAPRSPAPRAPRHGLSSLAEEDYSSHAADPTSIDEGFSLSADFMSSRGFEPHRMAGMPHEIYVAPHESSLDFSLLSRLGHGDSKMRDVSIPTTAAIDSALLALPPDPTDPQLDDKTFGTDGMGNTHAADSSANIRVVLSTLESLHMPSSMPTPGIDMILKVNSMAIGNLSVLLKDPCALNCSNITLLALVCCNGIIDAYQRLLLAQRNPTLASNEKGRSEDAMEDYFATAAIAADMQIAVGAFLPDSSVKQTIISSVLLSELTRLGNIIERIIPSSRSPAIPASRNIKDGGEFTSTLKPLLKEKLRAIVRVVKAEIMETDDI